MGKRKQSGTPGNNQGTQETPPSSDAMPCSSGTKLMSGERSSHLLDASGIKPLSPGMDVADNTAKLLNLHSSLSQQHHNLGRSMFLKRSRHHYGHHYSRRNSGSHGIPSTSHGKTALLSNDGPSFKFTNQSGSESGHIDNREKGFCRSERIGSSSLVVDAASSDAVKTDCGVCHKPLRRKPYFLGDTPSTGEFSVVAVLVCGHVFHADCLEERTSDEDKCDPPCLLCLGLLSQGDTSVGQA